MSRVAFSAAMTGEVDALLRRHLLRGDGQEDLCFAIWHPSRGATRISALIRSALLPAPGDRAVHGNASFGPSYFERALAEAAAQGGGLALLHSHPAGRGWQGMSQDDINAEHGHAAAAFGATGLPLVGLTLAGDGIWSARFWPRIAPRQFERSFCGSVRVIGDAFQAHFFDQLAPPPTASAAQVRTISSWGPRSQANLARLRVGVVGAGSVGGMVAESLARTGFEDVTLIDFDTIEEHNLDRLQYATRRDVGSIKVETLTRRLAEAATATRFTCDPMIAAVYEERGFRAALDCDLLFSCVDRPWGRHVLNLIAYAHMIPVFDGGIAVKVNQRGELVRADWRAHTCAPNRACLACLGQYSTGLVQAEREGMLDDPSYIEGLPRDHPLRTRENVFAFAMSCASFQVLQMLGFVISPLGLPGPDPQMYHFVGGFMEPETRQRTSCDEHCPFTAMIATGDHCGFEVLGTRPGNSPVPATTSAQQPKRRSPVDWLLTLLGNLRMRS